MRQLSLALTILCLLQSPTYAAAASPSDQKCVLPELASLDVSWVGSKPKKSFPVVATAIGEQPAKLIFESGSFLSLIKEDVAKQLKLPFRSLPPDTVGFGSTSIDYYIVVPRLVLGRLTLRDVSMGVIPAKNHAIDDQVHDGAIGILAIGGMTRVDVELDLRHDKINLFSSEGRCPVPVYWTDTYAVAKMYRGQLHDLYFDMELEGKKLQTKVSTTSNDAVIESTVSKKLYGFDETSPDVDSSHHYRAMALTANGLRVTNADMFVRRAGGCIQQSTITTDGDGAVGFASCFGVYPLTLGLDVLKELRVYIASKEGKMYFTSWDAGRSGATAHGEREHP